MKKLITPLSFVLISCFSFAQSGQVVNLSPVPVVSLQPVLPSPLATDTLMPSVVSSPCFTGDPSPLVYYTLASPNSGYLTGNCALQTIAISSEVAQRYPFTGNGTVSEVLVAYGYVNGTSANTSVKIYSVNASTKKPQTSLGTSANVTTGSINTAGLTSYTFSTPVSINADFFASVVLPSLSDTVAIASTKIGCNANDSLACIKFLLLGWNAYSSLIDAAAPKDTALDLFILPVVNDNSAVNELPSSGILTLHGAYPNPSTVATGIRYELSESSDVTIKVFDLSGRTIAVLSEKQSPGMHAFPLNISDLASGHYYYTIKTRQGGLTGKFVKE